MNSKTKSKAQSALVKNAGGAVPQAPAFPKSSEEFSRKVIRVPNAEQAASIVSEQAGLEYDAAHPEYHEAVFRQPILDKRHAVSEKQMDKLEEIVRATPSKIKSNACHVGSNTEKVELKDWRTLDIISVGLLALAAISCLVMSGANVFANLMLSGEPLYIEHPYIPVFLSLLAPSCSVAIKFIGTMFDGELGQKKRFTELVFFGSGATFVVWIVLFAMSNSGPSSDIDWGSFSEDATDLSAWLALTQLLSEVLVGGALFLAIQDIVLKYSPDYYCTNPAYVSAVKARDDFKPAHEELERDRNENHTRKTVLEAQRQAFINQKLVDFLDMKSRFSQLNEL